MRLPVLLGLVLIASCQSSFPGEDPLGKPFPGASGETLEGTAVEIPADFAGAPVMLLLGYVQKAQFDADRWLFGLIQSETPVRYYEVPTVRGLVPSMMEGTIDGGMRSGIPPEDWGGVITVYGSAADDIVRFTGNEGPRNMRVVLLDSDGRVCWFHDAGFSSRVLAELDRVARELAEDGAEPR